MDLSRVLAELRAELACLDEAIASLEQVAASRSRRSSHAKTGGHAGARISRSGEDVLIMRATATEPGNGPPTSE